MPDFHVVSLWYALRPSKDVSFTNPPPVEFETDDARFRLDEGKLTCEMNRHFANVDDACHAIEPAVRAWEVDADLRWGLGGLRFSFDGADVIDRTPPPPGVVNAYAFVGGVGALTATGTLSVHVTRAAYPAPPPPTFRLNPDAKSILARYQGYRDGREHLTSMAYFCITFLEAKAGSRGDAADAYRIDLPVLRKVGELTSTRGDAMNARKADAAKPLAGAEHEWLEAAVKMMIWRLGDTRTGPALPMVTMSDLPTL
jgi:hypothetical protein